MTSFLTNRTVKTTHKFDVKKSISHLSKQYFPQVITLIPSEGGVEVRTLWQRHLKLTTGDQPTLASLSRHASFVVDDERPHSWTDSTSTNSGENTVTEMLMSTSVVER